ncbi:hypothetical protein [Pseudonocardia lacus]|uniref:hypothetical protein n=1 Tax=Pseudonocardia lacus TaxID=2835865 RepID=UPI001BDD600D|nr:hypothetical protein [Pseudonocardia lacus]
MSRRPSTPLLAALAAAAVLSLSGCGPVGGSAHAGDAPEPIGLDTVAAASTATPGPAPAATPAPEAGAAATGGPASARPAQGGGNPSGGGAPAPAPEPAPKVTSLEVAQQPSCPIQGTPDAPFSQPGTDVKIAWSVSGASGAAVAVDDPGRYGAYGRDYPASGSLTLSFPCGATGTTTHTYTVWPAGAEGSPKTITVSARASG